MLNQNWFSKMDMYYEYYEEQRFYDKEVNCFYIVSVDEHDNINIKEIQPDSIDYINEVIIYEKREVMCVLAIK